ncbi:MAG TPA: hypothetical protein VFF95_09080 [Candidatus Binatus sp.]|nr:hypothetical protein [Candidatus Binatus sp.]
MKTEKLFCMSATALLALALPLMGGGTFAQDRDRDRDHDHPRFEDHDRQAARGWYNEHHDRLPEGLRDRDRLTPELESRLQVGVVLDQDLRHRIHPVPAELIERLPPCPPHYRYVIIGGHICLIDEGFHVSDVIHFELNL